MHLLQNLFLFLDIFRHLYWSKHIYLVLLDHAKIRLTASICRLHSLLLRETCCKRSRKVILTVVDVRFIPHVLRCHAFAQRISRRRRSVLGW